MAGTYTDIIDIICPRSAGAGELVTVEVRVRNLDYTPIFIKVEGTYDGVDISFSPEYASVDAGATYTFTSSFIMPNKDITLYIWSYYYLEIEWSEPDDFSAVDITLVAPPEVYAGTISRKRLEHDGTYDSIPAYNIPQGERGLVHIWGRNDMTTTQRMGISWIVRDPDGRVVEEYSTWEAWPYTSPGSTHEFIGGRFELDKPGTYTINIALSMNPADPEMVDSYYGNLCTVAAAVPEPQFRGFGLTEYIKV